MTKISHRLPHGLFLLLCLAVVLAIAANVLVPGIDVGAGIGDTESVGFSVGYKFQPTDTASLGVHEPAVAGGLLLLTLLCCVLTLMQIGPGVAACLLTAIAIAILFLIVPPANPLHDHHGLTLERQLAGVAAIFVAYLVALQLKLFLRRHRVNGFLRQFVPAQLHSHYMSHPEELGRDGESRHITIMFCDIKRFTAISERIDPELLPGWLNRYFDAVSEVVVSHGGTIDKYIGDSVMAFWGAPAHNDNHASDALLAAREILKTLETLSDQMVSEELPPIAVGIGVSTGKAYVGNLGSKERMTYTVVGDAVNTADRLQRCTSFYNLSLVVNDSATEHVPEFLFRELDTVHVKGRQRFVRIFQPICHQDDAIPNTHRQLQLHRKAMQFYRRGMWEDAEKLFRLLSDETQEVAFYRKYIERMVNIQKSKPADGASYIVDFTQKIG